MFNHSDILSEKRQIDDLMNKGYVLIDFKGTFDGDVVEFKNKATADKKTLLLTTADARKHYVTQHIKQQKQATQ